MRKPTISSGKPAVLRQEAEERLRKFPLKTAVPASEEDIRRLIHEFEVYQVEMEVQNVELKQALTLLADSSAKKYEELFDFAPSGYFSLSREGEILEVNLLGSQMLGKVRSHLKNARFGFFVSDAAKPVFNLFLIRIFKSRAAQSCEITLNAGDMLPLHVQLKGIQNADGQQCLLTVTDITTLKRAEEAQAGLALRYRTLLHTAADGIHVIDEDGKLIEANNAFCSMLGYTQDEMLQLHVSDWDATWSGEELLARVRNLFLKPSMFNTRHRRCDGTLLDVEINTSYVIMEGKRYLYAAARDITQYKIIENILRESEEKYRFMFMFNPQPMWIFDMETLAFLEVNQAAVAHYGYSREEFLKMNLLDIRPVEDFDELQRNIARTGDQFFPLGVFRHRKKNGELIYVELSAHSVIAGGRAARHVLINDITVRQQADDALFESERRAIALIEAIPDMLFILNQDGEYLYFKADIEDLALQADTIIGKKNRDIMPPAFADLVDAQIKLTIQKGGIQLFEYQLDLPGRGVADFEARMAPYGKANIIAIVRNVSQRKKEENKINLQNRELTKLNSEKDKFFSIIAHDLRSPFNGFLGLTELMAEKLPDMTLAEIQVMAQAMKKSATNLFSLLGNLLEWSAMQRGLTSFVPCTIELLPKIMECTGLVLEAAHKKEIAVKFDVAGDLYVFADRNMLGRILRNLMTNAVKFTPIKGVISVMARQVAGGKTEIRFTDTGIGMSPEMIAGLFRLDINTSRLGTEAEPSSGLGLIICKELVEKQGGELFVVSNEEMGSTFSFTLPSFDEEPGSLAVTGGPALSGSVKQSKRLKVIIAEDDKTSEILLSIVVKAIASEILFARNGIQAVEMCRLNPDADLVLMDIQLPGINGCEATRQIRMFNKTVVIIAQTAFASDTDREKFLLAGCNDCLAKPLDKALLEALMQKYFEMQINKNEIVT